MFKIIIPELSKLFELLTQYGLDIIFEIKVDNNLINNNFDESEIIPGDLSKFTFLVQGKVWNALFSLPIYSPFIIGL